MFTEQHQASDNNLTPQTYEASLIMTKYNISRLPIVADNRLLGIITMQDYAKKMYDKTRKDPGLMYMSKFLLLEH